MKKENSNRFLKNEKKSRGLLIRKMNIKSILEMKKNTITSKRSNKQLEYDEDRVVSREIKRPNT